MQIVFRKAKIIWMVSGDEFRPVGGIYPPELVRAYGEEFEFVIPPDPNRIAEEGYRFRDGRADVGGRSFVVNELSISYEAILIDLDSETSDAEFVLNKVLLIAERLGARTQVKNPIKCHMSTMVVDFDKSLNAFVKGFEILSSLMEKYMQLGTSKDLVAISFRSDPMALSPNLATLNPTGFKLERRVGTTHDLNRYFSEAHMKTEDHISLLEEVERQL